MKGRKPFGSRLKKAFVIAAAALGMGAGTGVIETMDKDPVTDTQNVTTYQQGTPHQYGYNISPLDQMWKHTLILKSADQISDDLFAAAETGDSWRVQALVDHGIDTNIDGHIALGSAIRGHHADVVKVLIQSGVDVNAGDGNALFTALRTHDENMTRTLLENGAHPTDRALTYAASTGQENMVRLLLQHDVDARADNSIALRAAAQEGHLGIVKILIEAGANPAAENGQALEAAAAWGHTDVVNYLLTTQNTYTIDSTGFSYVRVSDDSLFSATPPYKYTFTYNAVDVNADNGAALKAAVSGGHAGTVNALLAAGADVRHASGLTLAAAVHNGHADIVQALIDKGVDVNAERGRALHVAVMNDNAEMAQVLMKAGANPRLMNGAILEMAERSDNQDIRLAVTGSSVKKGSTQPPTFVSFDP